MGFEIGESSLIQRKLVHLASHFSGRGPIRKGEFHRRPKAAGSEDGLRRGGSGGEGTTQGHGAKRAAEGRAGCSFRLGDFLCFFLDIPMVFLWSS